MATTIPAALKDFRSLWWLFVLFGVLTAGAGIAVLVWPAISLVTLAVVIGIFLLVDGVFEIFGSIAAPQGEPGRGLLALLGTLSLIAGVIMVKHPFSTLVAFVIILGAWFIVAGVVRFVTALGEAAGRGANIAVGVLDIVAGVVVLAWPGLGLATAAAVAGIILIVRGSAFVWAGLQIRRLPEDPGGGPAAAPA
jgi:uncharacterized membrane protein HdeD (DUF308 family)